MMSAAASYNLKNVSRSRFASLTKKWTEPFGQCLISPYMGKSKNGQRGGVQVELDGSRLLKHIHLVAVSYQAS